MAKKEHKDTNAAEKSKPKKVQIPGNTAGAATGFTSKMENIIVQHKELFE
jgi:hypothetical protein